MNNLFVESIKTITQSLIHNAGFDKTRSGKIVGKNELTNSYSVKVDGHVYPNVRAVNDIKYNIGDMVKINIPVGQMSQAYISSSTFSDASIGKKIGHAEALIDAIDGSLEEVTEIDGHIYQIDITSVYGEESSAHTGHIYKDGIDVTDATYWNKFRWYLLTSSGKERQTDGVSNATLTMGIDRYLYGMSLILEWVDADDSVLLRKNIVLVSNEKIADVEEYASNAYELANNTANYFWHVESGTDTGAHITRVPKDTFLSATTDSARGYNFLAKPEGVALRYGLTELGHFTANGVDFQAYQNGTLYKTAELTPNALNFYYLGRKMADMSAAGVKFYDGEATPTEIASFSKDALSFNSAIPFSIGNGSRYIQWTGSGLNIITDSLYIGNQNIDTTISQAASATYRATCSTSSSTANKTATCAGFTLTAGATIALYMTQANTTTNALTLNINNTGAKAIYVNGTATGASNQLLWSANATVTFTYNGTYWYVADGAGTLYGSTCSTNASTAGKTTTVSSVAIFRGVSIVVPMTNDNTNASATLNVSSLGARNIYYGNTSTRPTVANGYSWVANSTATFTFDGQYWRLDDTSASKKASDAYGRADEAYGYAGDAYQNAEDAKQVATNYMYFDGTGLRIASASPSSAYSRTYITPNYIAMYDNGANRRFYLSSSDGLLLGRDDYDGTRWMQITDAALYFKYRADSSHIYNLLDLSPTGLVLRDTTGLQYASFGGDVIIGKIARGYSRTNITNGGMKVLTRPNNSDTDITLAHIGYDTGQSSSGSTSSSKAPYYTFGTRSSDTASTRGNYSFAEGSSVTAKGFASHAEGVRTNANNSGCHAEGDSTEATGAYSHAEGTECVVTITGTYGHAEGALTKVIGVAAHAEGTYTEASGYASHASGDHTKATADAQTVVGKYNATDSDMLFIVGNGTDESNRRNGFTVSKNGTAAFGAPVNTFRVTTETLFSTTMNSGNVQNSYKSVSNSGFYPIGIVGLQIGSGDINASDIYLNSQTAGSARVYYRLKNVGSTSRTVTAKVDVLWIKIA